MLAANEALKLLRKHPEYEKVLKPYLNGDEMIGRLMSQPLRFVIDFTYQDLVAASSYKELFKMLESKVLPHIKVKAEEESLGKVKANGRANQLNIWWKMWRRRENLLNNLSSMNRFISLPENSKRPIFEFISTQIRPNAKLIVFCFEDYYSYGILQSKHHWSWIVAKGRTLGQDTRVYTIDTVWDTFPWPQSPTTKQIDAVARAAQQLHQQRTQMLRDNKMSLRDLYRTLEKPGKNKLRDLHDALDRAVADAYGFAPGTDLLTNLLTLNHETAERERTGLPVQAPGLPAVVTDPAPYITDDCVRFNANV